MKEATITRRDELNDEETAEIASVLEGARTSTCINIDRKELREHLNDVLAQAGLTISLEDGDEDPALEEIFAEFASKPERASELRDQYQELADLIHRLERMLRSDNISPKLTARLRGAR